MEMRTCPSGERAIHATFFRFSKGSVRDLLLVISAVYIVALLRGAASFSTCRIATHFTRSNTLTRFPTGLSTEFPSGVKTTLPWRYTVPHKFWNWKLAFIVRVYFCHRAEDGLCDRGRSLKVLDPARSAISVAAVWSSCSRRRYAQEQVCC